MLPAVAERGAGGRRRDVGLLPGAVVVEVVAVLNPAARSAADTSFWFAKLMVTALPTFTGPLFDRLPSGPRC